MDSRERAMLIDKYERSWFMWKAQQMDKFWLAISWVCGKLGFEDASEKAYWNAADWWERGWECSQGM